MATAGERIIQGVGEIGGRVDEGAVEIENDRRISQIGARHVNFLSWLIALTGAGRPGISHPWLCKARPNLIPKGQLPVKLGDSSLLKESAALRALDLVCDGMWLGLGSGSTATRFVEALGVKVAAGLRVLCVPTSEATRAQAEALGIPLTTLDETPHLHLTVDGADEIDDQLRLIKGGGGALLREKIVATASDQMVVIADDSKLVKTLGRFPLPVEVVRFGFAATRRMVEAMAAQAGCKGKITQRRGKDGAPFLTDQGNFIFDCAFGQIQEPEVLAFALKRVPGVVEHGLFLGVADLAIVATADGVQLLQRTPSGE
jgi:ribose 5-phosphate isomerase A